jgi:hypothetical protein
MKVEEVINLINEQDELYCLSDAEDLLSEHGVEQVAYGLESNAHRWYEISTDVYQCEDGFVGVTGLGTMFSDMMLPSDCDVHCSAEEYEAVQVVTYRRKSVSDLNCPTI